MISVILPLAKNESKEKIKRCLDSLTHQTYEDFEAIIVTSPSLAQKFLRLFKKYPFVKVVTGDWNKSAARNIGAKKAKGKYLLHLDADMKLSPTLLSEFIQKACQGAAAIFAPAKGSKNVNFWGRCRTLERRIHLGDPALEAPQFIKKLFFEKIDGFDEDVDPLDDWGLHLALKENEVKFDHIKGKIIIYESPTIKEIVRRMYKRGQALPVLKKKYPNLPQMKIGNKIKMYKNKWQILCSSPLYTLGLFFLKIIDFIAFWWGMLHPKKVVNQRSPYLSYKVAAEYEAKRLETNYGRYKHFAECRALFSLLQKESPILEVGCGTGRITVELVKRGFSIIPTDPSGAMLNQFKKKQGLPKPIKASGDNLPFKDNQFKTVFALRVIWHIPPKEMVRILSQMSRVSSKFVILDIVNKKRFLARFLIGPNTYPTILGEFLSFCQERGLKAEKIIPLDISLPIWLNFLPLKLARALFPFLYQVDLLVSKLIPPGRYLVKLTLI